MKKNASDIIQLEAKRDDIRRRLHQRIHELAGKGSVADLERLGTSQTMVV
jgi:hypothetical protein